MGKNIIALKTAKAQNSLASEFNFQALFWHFYNNSSEGIALTNIHGVIILSNSIFEAEVLQPSSLTSLAAFVDEGNEFDETTEVTIASSPKIIKINRISLGKNSGQEAFLWITKIKGLLKPYKQVVLLKNLYRSFVNNTSEIVFRTSHNNELLFCNKLFMQSFAVESNKKRKTNLASLFGNPEDYQAIKAKVLLQENIVKETVNFVDVNGEKLVGLVNCQMYKDSNGEAVINWTVLDITQRVASEGILKAKNEELEKVNATMEKFLYSTSHDLRSPVTSILGLVNLLRIETKDKVLNDYIEKIEISAFKLDKIIRDLMGLTKTSYQCPQTKKINFEELVWSIINRYTKEANFKTINFAVNTNHDLPFYTDQERLEIILDNIIRNTIHFCDLNKMRSFVKINIQLQAKEVLVEVLDNGIGIGKDHQSQVFNMFYKASHQSKGAGLGLYIVKESLQQLNGSITLESEIGFGSVFRIIIPNGHKGQLISRKLQLSHQ